MTPEVVAQLGIGGVLAFVVWRTLVLAVSKGLDMFKQQSDEWREEIREQGALFRESMRELVEPIQQTQRGVDMIMERQKYIAHKAGVNPKDLPHRSSGAAIKAGSD